MRRVKKIATSLCALALVVSMLANDNFIYSAQATSVMGLEEETDSGEHLVFSEGELEWIREAKEELAKILEERAVIALVYLSDTFPVREAPDENSSVVAEVPSGQQVQILGMEVTSDYNVWE